MSLQTIISSVQSFFNYLFETFTMRTKPEYTPVHKEDYPLYLTGTMIIKR